MVREGHVEGEVLGRIRDETGKEITLAWKPGEEIEDFAAIEVYPAATLEGRSIDSTGYKGKNAIEQRAKILKNLIDRGPLTLVPWISDVARALALGERGGTCVLSQSEIGTLAVPHLGRERRSGCALCWCIT